MEGMNDKGLLLPRVIVYDHRQQAGSYKSSHACTIESFQEEFARC
ncbi:hypothetical protein SAMN05216558_5475 [Pseudomonas vancouverensis]|nr:hypothetical protein SAMN05216558_5475 [Pseudomonas vancouverensis]